MSATVTVWVLGDQQNIPHPVLIEAHNRRIPNATIRVLLIESIHRLAYFRAHRQKITLVLRSMRHYAAHLQGLGYLVDYRQAPSLCELYS
ncbi:MAG: cryptochrome/photolyase family protein [Anaerolineae bacterium]|nr:cryptochrome/photolyase family protein [Anaerolineae bacterium]